ncbi:efflux RND transporter periplasmic adaptor subunit [Paenibacillus motobuensis]|uniref:efflux RND transporter periplasmic adaptor subunit n=1 Tax=Paenibacillus TaxID=44249 RepID=UPI00203DF333|nr:MULTISPECIES: efflux RND transporter periplasmic adaptor subunit [Paenibacillus]MCM3041536.1 efflux RND transporter periplasmic adaptor subunit [Paenibacillus lutimineralis]MCM3648640.1 efflux RND transporter periplasmic adaptor subunit [Paenibacillus motobuensis]
MFKKKWVWGVILGLVLVVLVLANLKGLNRTQSVKVAEVSEGKIVEQIYTNGRLEPIKSVDVFSPVGGVVQALKVKEGDSVTKGQPLLTLKMDAVKEQLEKEKLSLELTEAERFTAKKQHFDKFKEQMTEDPDQKVEDLDLTSYDLKIRSSKLTISALEKQLNNSMVYASAGGVVTQVSVKEGQLMAEGSQLVTLADLSSFKVKANLTELDSGKVAMGMKAVVTGESISGTYHGEVTYLSPTAVLNDATSKDASVVMEVTLTDIAAELRPGYNVSIEMEIPDKPRILVPIEAVKYEGEEVFVFKIEGDKAVKSIVKIGKEGEEQVEVVTGVSKGDRVVVGGADQLRDGDKVKVE